MKRAFCIIFVLLLALSMLLVGCNEEPPAPDDPTPPENGGEQTNPPATDTTFKKTENYMPADVYAQMKTYFEGTEKGFHPYDDRINAPYVSTDVFAISDCTVKSITIPVYNAGKPDADGNLIFSIYVLPNDWASLREALKTEQQPIQLKINAAEYGFAESTTVRKFIKIDLTDYNIKLSDKQTLGFSHKDDTLIPARVLTKGTVDNNKKDKYVPAKYMIDNWGVVGYYYQNANPAPDESGFEYVDNSLLFDFELERTYESEAAYNALIAQKAADDADYAKKLAAVKAAYNGKTVSLIGDSMSTFNGITNDASLGLGNNPCYSKYTLSGAIYDYTQTYWGKVAYETGMELGIINAWGGGKTYGWVQKYEGKDGMLLRSYNLARNGKNPDVVLLNFATNDMGGGYSSAQDTDSERFSGNMPAGNLYQRLTAENKTKTDKEIVAEWFAEVEQLAAQGGFDPADPATITYGNDYKSNIYTCWEAAYALSVKNVQRLYEGAEIYCFTLPDRNHNSSTHPRLDKANVIITALAEYFEVGLVRQIDSEVNRANCIMYGCDSSGLHPNGKGHAALAKVLIEAMYENLPK